MALVLAALLAVWLGGRALGLTPARRWGLAAGLLGGVLLAHALLPADHPLPAFLGGNFAAWATGAGALGLGALYGHGLARVRARAPEPTPAPAPAPTAAPPQAGPFSEAELTRYARHIALREVGGTGQKALKRARVLVVGAGGLGSPVLLYLAGAGVGTIGVIDDDAVSASNLQRQVIHRDADIGTPKVLSAARAMRALNPFVTLHPEQRRLTEEIAAGLFAEYDLIVEASDNFATRYLVNRVAAAQGKPVVGGAISQWEGQVALWHPAAGAPCFQCVFPEAPAPGLAPTCAEVGVMGPLPGVVGSMMALEVVKHITGAGESLAGRLLIYDGLHGESRLIRTRRRPACPVCGG